MARNALSLYPVQTARHDSTGNSGRITSITRPAVRCRHRFALRFAYQPKHRRGTRNSPRYPALRALHGRHHRNLSLAHIRTSP